MPRIAKEQKDEQTSKSDDVKVVSKKPVVVKTKKSKSDPVPEPVKQPQDDDDEPIEQPIQMDVKPKSARGRKPKLVKEPKAQKQDIEVVTQESKKQQIHTINFKGKEVKNVSVIIDFN